VIPDSSFAVFGMPDRDLAATPAGASQLSPHVPGALALEDLAPASLEGLVMAAPPGTLERQYALALSMRALRPGAPLTVMAPKTKGGNRIAKELGAFGCVVDQRSRRHHRISQTTRPATFDAAANATIAAAIAAGAPCFVDSTGLWSQPGVFSWDRIDTGTALLLSALPPLTGRGADLGCGLGVIARAALASTHVTHIDLIDIDRRAISAARRNVTDTRARFHWADVRVLTDLKNLDFVVMNPPFHDGGVEDRALGESFVKQAHQVLRDGGTAWLVANLHLPYESVLSSAFSKATLRAEKDGFKVYEAQK
jgi:16S rRNA (guanine1207-N2)-methyltransferase